MKKMTLLSLLKARPVLALAFCCLTATFSASAQIHIKGMVMLIDYPDAPFPITKGHADTLFNQVGFTESHVTSTVRDYWYRQSRGKVIMTHDVVGIYHAAHTAAWYNTQPYDSLLVLMDTALVWFRNNNPGYPWDSLTVSTTPGEEGTFLSMNFFTSAYVPGSLGTHAMGNFTAPNGIKTWQCTAQLFGWPAYDGSNINLFWICHELCHSVWGLPDLYNGSDASHGTGFYSVLSGNTYTGDVEPVGGPFLAQLGWVTTVDVCTNQDYTLRPDGDTVARFLNPADPKEFYIVEARKKSTVGNAIFPVNKGLVIWHVDSNKVGTYNTEPQMTYALHDFMSIVQADGLFDLEHHTANDKMDSGDIYLPGKILNDTTTPNSKWWNGSTSNFNLSNITFPDTNHIKFHNQYCNTTNCAAGAILSGYEYISNVHIGSINHTSGAATYSDFTSYSTNVTKGTNVSVSVSIGDAYEADQILIWCDWNKDGDFNDPGELVFTPTIGANPATGTIAIPSTASTGDIKMRVRMQDTGNPPLNSTPCGYSDYGEVEDYTLHVVSSHHHSQADAQTMEKDNIATPETGATALDIHPNPNTGEFTITINNGEGSTWICTVINATGQTVYQESLPVSGTQFTRQIYLSNVAKGMYFVKLSDKKGKELNKKILIQ